MVNNSNATLQALEARSAKLLDAISAYCQQTAMAESTFGRRAVNDGKFVSRLRDGARITPQTLARVTDFLARNGVEAPAEPAELLPLLRVNRHGERAETSSVDPVPAPEPEPDQNFRFFDNRQKYLLFVNTCSEKEVVAQRVGMELSQLHPRPPALRVFDAGMGEGTVLTRVMRQLHRRFPTVPLMVVGKEISLEDVRLSLEKMADRFFEHPATVLVVTNMYYTEAPQLQPRSTKAQQALAWREVAITGTTSSDFIDEISALEPWLAENWQVRPSPKTGNPLYERPAVLVIYRHDYRFLLHDVIPQPGRMRGDYDLIIASQPYRLRVPLQFKAGKIITPLARALRTGGRLLGIHSCGDDPGLEIIRKLWPDEAPYQHDRHDILRAAKADLGRDARHFNFNAYADARAVFSFDMRVLPTEISASIGTSTLFAAWNAAVYVNQIDDQRLATALGDGRYLEATREVLQAHGQLWFRDESYVISRKRD